MSAVDLKALSIDDILGDDEIFSVGLTWLIEGKLSGELLSLEHDWEWVSSRVLEVNFPDFDRIVSKEVVHDVAEES